MITPWHMLTTTEAGLALAIWSMLVGVLCGMALVCCLFWRRLTAPTRAEEIRRLRADLDEAGAQIRSLLSQNGDLAMLACQRIGERPR